MQRKIQNFLNKLRANDKENIVEMTSIAQKNPAEIDLNKLQEIQVDEQEFNEVRELQNEKYKAEVAAAKATKIQALFRGRRVRGLLKAERRLNEIEELRKQDVAVTKIQARYRGKKARKQLHELRLAKENEEAAKQYQKDRNRRAQEELELEKEQQKLRAEKSRKRDEMDNQRAEEYKKNRDKIAKQNEKDAKDYQEAIAKRAKEAKQREEAALIFQTFIRGHKDRKTFKEEKEKKAALNIQRVFRGYKVRKAQKEAQAATKIQAVTRGFITRRRIQKEVEAATKIQTTFREYKVRKAEKETKAATKIQAVARGFITRRRIQKEVEARKLQLETHNHNVKTRLKKSSELFVGRRDAEKNEAPKRLFYRRLKIALIISAIILGSAAVAAAIVFSGGFAALGGLVITGGGLVGEFAATGIIAAGLAAVAGAFIGLGMFVKSIFNKILGSRPNVPNEKDPIVISTRAQMLEVMKQFNPEEFTRKELPKEARPEEHALSAIATEYQDAIRIEGATELECRLQPAVVNNVLVSQVGKFAPASKNPKWEGEAMVRDKDNNKLVFESELPRPQI